MSNLIKVDDTNNLPDVLREELAESSKENLIGVEPRLPKAQLPTGRGKLFTLEVIGGDDKDTPELRGIVLYQSPSKAYWEKAFGGGSASGPPDCASHDGIKPSDRYPNIQSANCAECRHNRFGTAKDATGASTRGKACRDVKRVVVLLEDDPDLPYLLTIPPTGLRTFDQFLMKLRKEKRPIWSVLSKISLTTETNKQGIEYPRIVPEIGGYINDPVALNQVKEWRAQWTDLLNRTMFDSADVKPAQDSGLEEGHEPEYHPPVDSDNPEY